MKSHFWKSLKGMDYRYIIPVACITLYTFGNVILHAFKLNYWTIFIFEAMIVYIMGFMWAKFWGRSNQVRWMDKNLYRPTEKELVDAHTYAKAEMALTGYKLENYIPSWQDCDDFAERMCTLMKDYIRSARTPKRGLGIGIAPVPYIRDKDGKGHVCVEAYLKPGKSKHFEVYPGYGELILSKKELKSRAWKNWL